MAELIQIISNTECLGVSREKINNNFYELAKFVAPHSTAADLLTSTASVNTTNKAFGKLIFDTDHNRLMVAYNSDPASPWHVINNPARFPHDIYFAKVANLSAGDIIYTTTEGTTPAPNVYFRERDFCIATDGNGAVTNTYNGNITVSAQNLNSLYFSNLNITGNFNCSDNLLRTLQGAPSSVSGNFNCTNNFLSSMEYAPHVIGGHVFCGGNLFTSPHLAADVKGTIWDYNIDINARVLPDNPYYQGGYFSKTPIINLGSTLYVSPTGSITANNIYYRQGNICIATSEKGVITNNFVGDISLSGSSLSSLYFSNITVTGNFNCGGNNLTSLRGSPINVAGNFICRSNPLSSTEGAPSVVGGDFDCRYSNLSSLQYSPHTIGGLILIGNDNQISFPHTAVDNGNIYWTYVVSNPNTGQTVRTRAINPYPVNSYFSKIPTIKTGVTLYSSPTTTAVASGVYFKQGDTCIATDGNGVVTNNFTGNIDVSNQSLSSLYFSNLTVNGNFNCSHNQLTSVNGFPAYVSGSIDCSHNNIVHLAIPYNSYQTFLFHGGIQGNFNCSYNQLTSFSLSQFKPVTNIGRVVNGIYIQEAGTEGGLWSLDNMYINGNFDCSYNQLITLSGGGSFQGKCPSTAGTYNCSHNNLPNMRFVSDTIFGNVYCAGNLFDLPHVALNAAGQDIRYNSDGSHQIVYNHKYAHGNYFSDDEILRIGSTLFVNPDVGNYDTANVVAANVYFKQGNICIATDNNGQVTDVYTGNITVSDQNLTSLYFSNIKQVIGTFNCSDNLLSSLNGSPQSINGNFVCSNNQLTGLQSGPTRVTGQYKCNNNSLSSLSYCPSNVTYLDCSNNYITTLQYSPSSVSSDYICSYNSLVGLSGGPLKVGGLFDCSYNSIHTLQYSPSSVGGNFNCSYNQLVDLQYAPAYVGGTTFNCSNNNIPLPIISLDIDSNKWSYGGSARSIPLNRYSQNIYFSRVPTLSAGIILYISPTTTDVASAIYFRQGDICIATDNQGAVANTWTGNLTVSGQNLTSLYFSNLTVTGNFDCSDNLLTGLRGSPLSTGGDFNCSNNKLISLQGAPSKVNGSFYCYNNQLDVLEYSPSVVPGSFVCHDNYLTTLFYAPSSVGGTFDCSKNKLTTLSYAPKIVTNVNCSNNRITTLVGSPSEVTGYFNCSNNGISTLQHAPSSIGGYFDCSYNSISTLNYSPSSIGGYFNCLNNKLYTLSAAPAYVGEGFTCFYNQLYFPVIANDVDGKSWLYNGTTRLAATHPYAQGIYFSDDSVLSLGSILYINSQTKDVAANVFYQQGDICIATDRNGAVTDTIVGNISLAIQGLSSLYFSNIVTVSGNFDCSNVFLSSLSGSPQQVTGNFNCSNNLLSSLRGAPQQVNGIFNCSYNQLTALQYAPPSSSIICNNNRLTSLSGAPINLNDSLLCNSNLLTTLQYAPSSVGKDFNCSNNQLTTLQYAPSSVGGDFNCSSNLLVSMLGSTLSTVGGTFNCNSNQLSSLEYAPAKVGKNFYCYYNQLASPILGKDINGLSWEYVSEVRYRVKRSYIQNSVYYSNYPLPQLGDKIFTTSYGEDGAPNLFFQKDGLCIITDSNGIVIDTYTGDLNISGKGLTSLYFSNIKVTGSFNCASNQLSSLENSPYNVGSSFYCSNNQLTTLYGAPTEINGDFICNDNQLTTLHYAPSAVSGTFNCSNNLLTNLQWAPSATNFNCSYNNIINLQGAPVNIYGYFNCSYNSNLQTLMHAPTAVIGNFDCSYGSLSSIQFAPLQVGGVFDCSYNRLSSIQFAPPKVESFNCSFNTITNLSGAPLWVNTYFDCSYNQLTSIKGPLLVYKKFDCSGNAQLNNLDLNDAPLGDPISQFVTDGDTGLTLPAAAVIDAHGNYWNYSNGSRTIAYTTQQQQWFANSVTTYSETPLIYKGVTLAEDFVSQWKIEQLGNYGIGIPQYVYGPTTNHIPDMYHGWGNDSMYYRYYKIKCVNFDGNGYISIPLSRSVSFGKGDFTFEFFYTSNIDYSFWNMFAFDSYEGNNIISSAGLGTLVPHMINYYSSLAGPNAVTNAAPKDLQEVPYRGANSAYIWHHLALRRRGSQLEYFLDGKRVTSVTDSSDMFSNGALLTIGARPRVNNNKFIGRMAGIRFSNVARGIEDNMLQSSPPFHEYRVPINAYKMDINTTLLLNFNTDRYPALLTYNYDDNVIPYIIP